MQRDVRLHWTCVQKTQPWVPETEICNVRIIERRADQLKFDARSDSPDLGVPGLLLSSIIVCFVVCLCKLLSGWSTAMLGSVLFKGYACLLQFDSAFIDDTLEPSMFCFAGDDSQMKFCERLGQLRRCVRVLFNQSYLLFAGHRFTSSEPQLGQRTNRPFRFPLNEVRTCATATGKDS
jgi:hypothetical protein